MPYPIFRFLYIIAFILFSIRSFGQKADTVNNGNSEVLKQYKDSRLDDIRKQLIKGNKETLLQLAPYLDSTQRLSENLGYHFLQTPERTIAYRLIDENCNFLRSELPLTDSLRSKVFISFLKSNWEKISFDSITNSFLITPLIKRNARCDLRALSATREAQLNTIQLHAPIKDWMKQNNIEQLVQDGNPIVLYKIAAKLYQGRNRFDAYQKDADEYVYLLERLTRTEFGVEDDLHRITFHMENSNSSIPQLNLLIYFAKCYNSYHWNPQLKVFVNSNVKLAPVEQETVYFQLLKFETDTIALDAFIKLTTCDAEKVAKLADDYSRSEVFAVKNDVLPIFPYRFLKQLSLLTAYCTSNQIDYTGSPVLIQKINKLKQDLSFAERRRLEDELIGTMSIDDVTALEYWTLIFEENWNLTHSTGRILNVYYSRHWSQMLRDKKQLNTYLKKSKLYDDLGIIGICNNYLKKFAGSDSATITILRGHTSTDHDITQQLGKAITIALKKPVIKAYNKFDDGNHDTLIINLNKDFQLAMENAKDLDDRDYKISKVISNISYFQIGTALSLMRNYNFKGQWDKYDFLKDDFGFFMVDINDAKQVKEFTSYYNLHTQKQLYAYYLKKAGLNYLNTDGSLNYDKIYELLKYDVVTAFVGGGGGKRDNEVYSLIKLLELQFKTRLGFPAKLCNSANLYACDSSQRVIEWMQYLERNQLLKLSHHSPVSFSYE